jgi:hypothetical protein
LSPEERGGCGWLFSLIPNNNLIFGETRPEIFFAKKKAFLVVFIANSCRKFTAIMAKPL